MFFRGTGQMFKVRRRLPIVAIIVVIVVVVRVVGMWWRFLCGSGMGDGYM